jgi:signal transduction histidine kinase
MSVSQQDHTAVHKSRPAWQPVLETITTNLKHLQSYHLPDDIQVRLERIIEQARELPELLSAENEQVRLAALYQVSHSLGSSLNLDEVLNQVMDAVIGLTGAERGFLMLHDADTDELLLRSARNVEHETLQHKDAISRTVIDAVMRSGSPVLTTDAQTDPRFARQESVMLHSLRSIMCVPLRTRGELIGVIYVDNRIHIGLFTNEELNLLNAFASQAAIAIENARLYGRTDQALNQRLTELETLTQIDRELNDRLEFDHVMDITLEWAKRGTQAMDIWVGFFDPETSRLRFTAGDPSTFPTSVGMPDFHGELSALVINREEEEELLAAPLFEGGKLVGLIAARKSQPFSHDQKQFLTRLAARAANAVENARLYEAVRQANQEKTKFISVVSHELRIPMTSIRGYTDLLRQQTVGPVNEQQRSFLETIRGNVDRMAALVSDLSDISRIESGRLKLELGGIDLGQQVEQVLTCLQPQLQDKGHELQVDMPDGLPRVIADGNRVTQVLNNLVTNACKYTAPGGRITITGSPSGNVVRVAVKDSGIGISPDDQQRLFEQFFRSEETSVRQEQGWGLGLSVARRLVELMRGEMGFESTYGQGSTFWFTLPAEEKKR